MPEKILVPLDGSSEAETALPYAEEIAARIGSEIFLVSVSESKASDIDNLYSSYLERISEKMESQIKSYGAKGAPKVNSDVLLGEPASKILRYAVEKDVDLIIMAIRGVSGKGPRLLGNIAARTLRATRKPVLLIRTPASDNALEQKKLVKKILLPLDGSKIGESAVSATEMLARAFKAEVVLFQAGETIIVSGGFDDGQFHAEPTQQDLDRRKAFGLAYLEGVRKPFKEGRLKTSSVLVLGPAPDLIMDYADENSIDLIAMSTHGRSGIGRWVYGSVTDKVLHAGDTPLLVVRATAKK